MAEKKRVRSERLTALRESGALAATFHPDGSLASVTFAPPAAPASVANAPAPEPAKPAVVEEILASPKWPRTDLDALDQLPAYGEGN